MRAVILNAGKSTRLGGKNKMFVEAGGAPIHRWHERALQGRKVALVARKESLLSSAAEMPWIDRFVAHDENDGPVGALAAYLDIYHDDTDLLVVYADTLIPAQPLPAGDWVGVAPVITRTWDHRQPDGTWEKRTPDLRVGIGLYSFADIGGLRRCIKQLGEGEDQHLPPLLNLYEREHPMTDREIVGWSDGGDWAAIANVPPFEAGV